MSTCVYAHSGKLDWNDKGWCRRNLEIHESEVSLALDTGFGHLVRQLDRFGFNDEAN